MDDGKWRCERAPGFSVEFLLAAIDAIANYSGQSTSARRPILSAELPGGERVQTVRPPVSEHPVIVIRKPAQPRWNLRRLEKLGVFDTASSEVGDRIPCVIREAYRESRWAEYLSLSVRAWRNIIVAGPTGSGKTTLLKALAHEIPAQERLVTVEDVRELTLPHRNSIRLRYSRGEQGLAEADAGVILEACLRMRPDRILFGELRGEEAFQFLRNLNSGHPGSITSIHANSPEGAIDQLALLARQSDQGRGYGVQEMRQFAGGLIDVVVQMHSRRAVAIHDRQLDRT